MPAGGFTGLRVFLGSPGRAIRHRGRRMADLWVGIPVWIYCIQVVAWEFRAWDHRCMGRPRADSRYTAYPTREFWKRFWQYRALAGSPLGRRANPKRAKLHWRST